MQRPNEVTRIHDLNELQLIELMLLHAKYAYLKYFQYRYLVTSYTDDQPFLDWQYSATHFTRLFRHFYQRFVDKTTAHSDIENLASEIINNYSSEFKPTEYEEALHMKLNQFVAPPLQKSLCI